VAWPTEATRLGPAIGVPIPVLAAADDGPSATHVPASGPVLFARYAFGPNRLGYCGPEAVEELFGEGTTGGDDRALRQLARAFEGAWPYLELIARANGLADPLDRRVVEAYWLGNPLLAAVGPAGLEASLASRFRPRLRPDGWRWLAAKPDAGAVPVHAFHVLDVFPRIGLLRSGSVDRALEVMDSCRIRWGRVLERDGEWLVASVVPLAMVGGRLELGPARPERVQAWRDGAGFVDGVAPGDVISIHWSWACDRLTVDQLGGLMTWTAREIGIANLTI
jgi:hypothetical protein